MPQGNPAEPRRSIILGTAGHIDHGKTALVRALTGVDTDRLPEEKRRGLTIDLGFASFEAQSEDGSPLQLSLVDVPGHARFVRNMLAGAAGIDAVLLIIAADKGVMPQTKEHLAICSLLGIQRGIVVLTKADLVTEPRLRETADLVREFLGNTFFASAPMIAVSAHSRSGIAELRRQIVHMAASIPARSSHALLRLPIDRAFVIKGFGTVVTGTLIGGRVRTGDELAIAPGGRIARVRGMQVHNRAEEVAFAGSRVALNLAHVETAEIKRGHTLTLPGSATAVDMVDVELSVLPAAPALKHRSRIHFHAFASECIATVTLYDAAAIEPGEVRLARLRLSERLVLLPEDRFVVRSGTPITTIGGGRLLDAHPQQKAKKGETAEWLRGLACASFEKRVWLYIARRGVNGALASELSQETGMTESALDDLVQRWILDGLIHSAGEKRWLTQESFAEAREAVLYHFRKCSQNNSPHVGRSELREQTLLNADVLDDALRSLEQDRRLQIAGPFVMPPTPATMPSHHQSLLASIANEYKQAGITPPSPDELGSRLGVAPVEMRRLITLLLRDKTLVRLNNDSLCVHKLALAALVDKIRTLHGQTLDVAAFKQLTGVSRKFAIPLLEYLDRERLTVRQGDNRLVR